MTSSVLAPPTLRAVPTHRKRTPLAKEQTFYRRETLPHTDGKLWSISSGFVRTSTWCEDGNLATLGFWGPGDIVGFPLIYSVSSQIECLSHVKAQSLTSVRDVSQTQLFNQLQHTQLLLSIQQDKHVRDRLLRFFVWLAERFGSPVVRGKVLDVRLTHQDIAEAVGATRVTITRLFGELESSQWIYRMKQNTILVSRKTLEEYNNQL